MTDKQGSPLYKALSIMINKEGLMLEAGADCRLREVTGTWANADDPCEMLAQILRIRETRLAFNECPSIILTDVDLGYALFRAQESDQDTEGAR